MTVQLPSCNARQFDYELIAQVDARQVTVRPWLMLEPIDYRWSVDGQVLSLGSDTLRLEKTVAVPMPPPSGTTLPAQMVEVKYRLGRSGILQVLEQDGPLRTLRIEPRQGDGNYGLQVTVYGTDAAGRTFGGSEGVAINGLVLRMGDDYERYVNDCVQRTINVVEAKNIPAPRVGPPRPDESLADVIAGIRSGFVNEPAAALTAVEHLTRVHGIAALNKAFERLG